MLSFPPFFLSTGLSIHTFHGNFFVRSTDLVSLPNVSPDSGFSMQIDIEDSLTDSNIAVFQSALLYTSTKGNVASNKPIAQLYHLFAPQARFLLLSGASLRRDCSEKKRGLISWMSQFAPLTTLFTSCHKWHFYFKVLVELPWLPEVVSRVRDSSMSAVGDRSSAEGRSHEQWSFSLGH